MMLIYKKRRNATEYSKVYRHNFHMTNSFCKEELIQKFVSHLSSVSKIEKTIVLLELKRFLMYSSESYNFNRCLNTNRTHTQALPFFFLGRLKTSIFDHKPVFLKKTKTRIDILIDNHTKFSHYFLIELRKKFTTMFLPMHAFSDFPIRLLDFISVIPSLFKLINFAFKIRKQYRIDLRVFVTHFFIDFLRGWYVNRNYHPRLIISGNDNGFHTIFGKATGAQVMLIQNGARARETDAAFKYADYFESMGDHDDPTTEDLKGCLFREILPLGSIRFAEELRKINVEKIKIEYDALWSYTLMLQSNTTAYENFNNYMPPESERRAIKLLNELAEKRDWKIAMQLRLDQVDFAIKALKELGLYSEKVQYIDPSKQNTYISLLKSEIILSYVSTVGEEALGFGKKVGFVNFSGNSDLNYMKLDSDFVFTNGDVNDFEIFLQNLKKRGIPGKYIIQNLNFFEDLLKKIAEIVVGKKINS